MNFSECALCPARIFYVFVASIRLKGGLARTLVQSTNILGKYFKLDENCSNTKVKAISKKDFRFVTSTFLKQTTEILNTYFGCLYMKIQREARHVGPCANYIRALLRPRSVDYNRACLSSCADCAMSIYMLLSSHFRACAATTVMVFVFVVVVAVAVCRFRCRCRSSCFVVDSRATIAAQNDANHVRKSHDKSART